MYDTVSGLLYEVPREVWESKRWERVNSSTTTATGDTARRRVLNPVSGLHLTLHESWGCLQAERSLPKALRGSNVVDLVQSEVPDALDAVDEEIGNVLGVRLPPFEGWQAARVDYCQNLPLGDELEVVARLRQLQAVKLPRRGLPVVGQDRSVSWVRGFVKPKFYGKYVESGGDPEAYGVLRYEVRVDRHRALKSVVKPGSGRVVTVGSALSERVRNAFLDRFAVFERFAVSREEMSDQEFVRLVVDELGVGPTMRLIGFAVLWSMAGYQTWEDLNGKPAWSKVSEWRALRDLRRVRDRVRREGGSVTDEREVADRMVELRRVLPSVAA